MSFRRNKSCFNLGIIAAKVGKTLNDCPFEEDDLICSGVSKKKEWEEGFNIAHSDKYMTVSTEEYALYPPGTLLKDKNLYEK